MFCTVIEQIYPQRLIVSREQFIWTLGNGSNYFFEKKISVSFKAPDQAEGNAATTALTAPLSSYDGEALLQPS